jgi:hypothetical protein
MIGYPIKTKEGIEWKSTIEDVYNTYGKPPIHNIEWTDKVTGDWIRIRYYGMDFMFNNGELKRISICNANNIP